MALDNDTKRFMTHGDGQRLDLDLQRIAEAVESIADKDRGYTLYGFHIDGSESDPSEAVTYLEDAVGMTPAKMDYTAGAFKYGSWRNAFFMPKPCMVKYDGTVDYYLDPNDYAKKADGTASDVSDPTYAGNAMVEWGQNGKKIWYKIVPDEGDANSASVYICDRQLDRDFVAHSFINSLGYYVDHFYTAMFNGSLGDSSTRMRSLKGQAVKKSLTGQNEIIACELNNAVASEKQWYTDVFADRMLINLLLILMGKSLDSQTVFGRGLDSGSETALTNYVTGALSDKGAFFGYNDGSHGVCVFHMENPWGAQWRRTAGLNMINGVIKAKFTYPYNEAGTGYETVGQTPTGTSGGYISKMVFTKDAMVASVVSGSATTNYCDGQWWNASGNRWALFGGASDCGASCGSFCCYLDSGLSYARWSVGCALSLKPLA